MVYIIREEGSNYYKIGYTASDDIQNRLSSLQTANPRRLIVIGILESGTEQDERKLHARLLDHKTDGGEEWFALDDALLSEVMKEFSNERQNQYSRPIEGPSAFDVRQVRGRQFNSASDDGEDVP